MADTSIMSLAAEGADRRKSGRSIRKPEIFSQEHHEGSLLGNGAGKRKRPDNGHLPDADGEDLTEDESDDDENEDDPDEEELLERKRAARNRKPSGKPATKKSKTAIGGNATLAIRSANIQRKPASKTVKPPVARARPSQMHEEGLYAEVFGCGQTGADAAADWLQALQQDSVTAIRDLVNFILRCTACDLKVDNFDIEDVDNVASKVGEVLDEFQSSGVVEYPLISKLKQHVGFQAVLVDFVKALVHALHNASILYDDPAVFENIQVWVATMSSATFIPCRHTATVISLAMSTALCEIAQSLQGSIATSRAQFETERKKKTVNKGRVKGFEDSMANDEKKLTAIDEFLKDAFDTVFVHRYRDVNERLRVECVTALGSWISLYRKMFLEGQYLRYLGWVLSDTYPQTRGEVLKQLKSLFKSQKNIAALRAFTERFRPRMVEIGERDTDQGVRAEAIELLDRLRNAELLEPNDIDTIGQLIFDPEPRVRKSVARFFVSNVEDLFKASIEDMDEEQLTSVLPEARDEDDYMMPTQAWIKYKCLAQSLTSQDAEKHNEMRTGLQSLEHTDSRYVLATQAIFPHMEELRDWESLAGYLLYDHSEIMGEADDPDVALAVQGAYKLDPGEETALLDVLYCAVKLHLQYIVEPQGEKKGKKTNVNKNEILQQQEDTAQNLNTIIPQLLSKFGSVPHAAVAILRLEQLLNIDLINNLHGDATITALLEDINKQFMNHSDRAVLTEAKMAFHEARRYEQSKEAAETKIKEVWDDTASSLQNLLKGQNVETRGTLSTGVLTQLANTASRLASLASIWDCSTVLEDKLTTNKKSRARASHASLLELLLDLAKRGIPDEDTTHQFARLEDDLCSSVTTILAFYFRWKAYMIKTSLTANSVRHLTATNLTDLAMTRVAFVEILSSILVNRSPLDPIRVQALNIVPEIFTIFAPMRFVKPTRGPAFSEELTSNLTSLVIKVPEELQNAILQTHDKMERMFAKRTRRKIDRGPAVEVAEDAAPVDSDDEDDSDEEPEDLVEADHDKEGRKRATVQLERDLCELTGKLVLAIVGGILDQKIKEALLRNRTKLGRDYAAVVAYLDHGKKGAKGKGKAQSRKPQSKEGTAKSAPMIIAEDDIEDDEMEGEEEQDGEEQEQVQEDAEDEAEGSAEPEEIIGD
jgi:cohesin complex subunit SA-1/2